VKLDGITVVDLSLVLPGPFLTQMMQDHGAQVICVEPPPHGDPSRELDAKSCGHTPWFRNTHRGKASLCLNLKSASSRKALLQVCKTADVFVEAFRPGVCSRLGIGYEQVKNVNPNIIYCSITAFGQTGPYNNRPAHDINVEALSGSLSANSGPDDKPVMPGVLGADMAASLMAFGAVTMALFRREKTGEGDYIDISMQDALMGWMQNVVSPAITGADGLDVKSTRWWGGRAFYNVYETSDGKFLTLGGDEPKFVNGLLSALGRNDLVSIAYRPPGEEQKPLVDFLRTTFLQKTLAGWTAWLSDKDICYGPVLSMDQAFRQQHVIDREMLLTDDEGNKHIGIPIKYRNEPGYVRFKAPRLNEDAERILTAAGLTPEELESMRQSGALWDVPDD